MKVTALLVTHNGGRWLPAVLAGVAEQTLAPDRFVAVDTGSDDDSAALVTDALGVTVHHLDPATPYGAAVRAGLARLEPAVQPVPTGTPSAPPPAAEEEVPGSVLGAAEDDPDRAESLDEEWVWLLHDDARPDPQCLARLVAAAETAPGDVAALGPKIREWPSLKRLLEVGVTLSGTGRRETGLERGEYDQGQHETQHDVLAVNTAGMLVRRRVLEQLGLDDELPVFGNDLDLGWRAARAGHRIQVVPDAHLFHVEAARRGLRTSALVSHPHRQEREGALFTLVANTPAPWLPFRVLRMLVGGLLRAIGLLLVRAPGEAADELLALASVLLRPGRVLRARRARRGHHEVPHKEVRHLLAPFWLPWRHGLDFVADVWVALTDSVRDAVEVRRAAAESAGDPWWRRVLGHPGTLVLVALVVLALVVNRGLLGTPLHGGALLPAPDGVGHWWELWASRWHALGTGSDASAPAYLLPLAVLGTLLVGQPGLLVTALFVLAVPLAYLGALRFFRRLVPARWVPVWAAASYALLVVVGGAVDQGRLGTVVSAVLLPWVASPVLSLARPGTATDPYRWRATWRVALGLGLLTAFTPTAWLVALLLGVVGLLTRAGRDRGRQLLVVLGWPLLLVLPWALSTNTHPAAWLVEAGKAGVVRADPGLVDLLLGRAGGPGAAPAWLGAGLVVAALLALLRPDSRRPVASAWVVAAAAAVVLAVTARVDVELPGVPEEFHAWTGFLVLLVGAALVSAVAIAAHGATALFSRASFGWRHPVAALAVLGALGTTIGGAAWWVLDEHDDQLVGDGPYTRLPTYLTQLAASSDIEGVLVIEGGTDQGVQHRVLRNGPLRIGDDGVLAMTDPDPRLDRVVEDALAARDTGVAATLAGFGLHYVLAPPPVDSAVSGGFDATPGLTGASAPEAGSRAWRVEEATNLDGMVADRANLRPLWLVLQVLAFITAIVAALPEGALERRRR